MSSDKPHWFSRDVEVPPGASVEFIDHDLAAILGAVRAYQPVFTVTEIVRRVEVDGTVIEVRVSLSSPVSREDAA